MASARACRANSGIAAANASASSFEISRTPFLPALVVGDMLLQSAVTILQEYPELAIALGLLLRIARAWQTQLSWYEYRTLHGMKRLLFPVLDRRVPVVSFVNAKGGRDDAEYLDTWDMSIRQTVSELREADGSLHLISALKRRPAEHGDALTRAHLVWTHSDGQQTECYLFGNDDGTTDAYAHVETAVSDPLGHLTDRQTDGDTRDVVPGK